MSTSPDNKDEVSLVVVNLASPQRQERRIQMQQSREEEQKLQRLQQRQELQRKRRNAVQSNKFKERLLRKLVPWRHESSNEMIERIRGMKRLEAHKIPIWSIPVIAFLVVLLTLIFIYILASFVTQSISPTTPPTISSTGGYIPELYIYCFVCNWIAVLFFVLAFAKYWQLQVVRKSLYRIKTVRVLFAFVNLNVLLWGLIGAISFGLQAAFSVAVGAPHNVFAILFFGSITFHILFVGLGDVILFLAMRSKWRRDMRRHRRHYLLEEHHGTSQTSSSAAEGQYGFLRSRRKPRIDSNRSRFRPERSNYINIRKKYLPAWLILFRFLVTVALFGSFVVLAYYAFTGPSASNQDLMLSIFEYGSVALQMIFLVTYCYDFYVFELAILMSERANKNVRRKGRSIFSAQSTGQTPVPPEDINPVQESPKHIPTVAENVDQVVPQP